MRAAKKLAADTHRTLTAVIEDALREVLARSKSVRPKLELPISRRGGGTLPGWRGRGVFGSLVAHRAALASSRGFRYLQVDATPESRPILQRLGFVELATTTPFTHPGSPPPTRPPRTCCTKC